MSSTIPGRASAALTAQHGQRRARSTPGALDSRAKAKSTASNYAPPLIVHVVYRFDTGGLENGIVNLLNHMPADAYRHVIVALTDVTDYAARIRRDDVEIIALHKKPGHGFWLYPALYRLFRRLRPTIVHSRNLAALEAVVPAWLARVPIRIHGEHGRDVGDLNGENARYHWVRRFYRPFVHQYVALSRELATYLTAKVHVPRALVTEVCNGVDTVRFSPVSAGRPTIPGCPFVDPRHWIIGTVGRMQVVKDQVTLARAFVRVVEERPELKSTLRLVMVGEGPLRAQCQRILDAAGISGLAWLSGARGDVEIVMRGLNCFVLPSLAEGISNTILEAMSSGLPVIATAVGGNADLVSHGTTGEIVPPGDVEALAASLLRLAEDRQGARAMGAAGRLEAERRFSLATMVAAYQGLYERQLQEAVAASPRL